MIASNIQKLQLLSPGLLQINYLTMAHFKNLIIIAAVCIFISCAGTRTANNSYKFEETTKLTQATPIKKILIVGSGGINSHFFLDNISEELKRKFKDVNVETGYEFLGYKKDFTNQLNKLVSTREFDAVLQFTPLNDFEKHPIVLHGHGGILPNPNYNIRTTSMRFKQDFMVTLFKTNNSTHPIWKASLNTNLDSRQNIFYTRIAIDILKHLQETYK